jgi:glycosyltransferase involved in cell wall biosynthesis
MEREAGGGAGSPARTGVVVFRRTGGPEAIDAIDEYSRRLVGALGATGVEARYEPGGLSAVLQSPHPPRWVLLQYNPFRYGRSGFAPRLVLEAWRLRRRRVPLAIMVHEAWVDIHDPKSALIGLWQRLQLRVLLRLVVSVMTTTEALAREIGGGAVHVPVASNIDPVEASPDLARERLGLNGRLVIAAFGRGNLSRALADAEEAIAAVAESRGADRVTLLNLGAGAPTLSVPGGVVVRAPGALPAEELSLYLRASDLVLLPFKDGLSTRRSTLMAALAHGRPVLGLRGHNTDDALGRAPDAIVLTRAGDRTAFARAAVELASDPARMRATGGAGRQLYESSFDWPVLAEKVLSVIAPIARTGGAPAPGREIVFVAHDVGGPGGMERHTEQLINRLLAAGRRVTVVARTCKLAHREGLTFVRVRTPARPFPLAYPAFFAVASLLVARHKQAVRHSTGAIIANRVDVTTVHCCHAAVGKRLQETRSTGAGWHYRVNAALSRALSLAGEAWCYRPSRTALLCALSAGQADEIKDAYPASAGTVHTIPNGVDLTAFRPNAAARAALRSQLRLSDEDALAVFVGGDWVRKGLPHAIDALAAATRWHLAVAGPGDPQPLINGARAAGTEARLHFLGSLRDTSPVYAAADALVLPTAYESFSLIPLEAAATGVPLLVTPVNGVRALLIEGESGWFIRPDGPDIARRLEQLRTDPALAAAMAEGARAAAQDYSWDAMADRYLSLYGELARDDSGL